MGAEFNFRDITFDTNSLISTVLTWFLFSLGLWLIARKMKWQKPWLAWIPGLRYIALGQSLDMTREGIFISIAEAIMFISSYLTLHISDDRIDVAISLLTLILIVFMFVYRIRIILRLIQTFGRKRSWIILWILASELAVLIFGFSKKFQPVITTFDEDDDKRAGTAPAEIAGASALHNHKLSESGLSIDLRERTARDLGKKRYLLKDISLDIPNGSLVMLLGGSGSGKTTLVNAIIGYEKADADVTLNGGDIYRNYSRMKYKIGFHGYEEEKKEDLQPLEIGENKPVKSVVQVRFPSQERSFAYDDEYSQGDYFAAVSKSALMNYAVDRKEKGSIVLG